MDIKFSALIRGAFGGHRYAYHDVCVSIPSGEVRVWDEVAGYYTLVHSLTPRQQRRLRSEPVVRAARRSRAT